MIIPGTHAAVEVHQAVHEDHYGGEAEKDAGCQLLLALGVDSQLLNGFGQESQGVVASKDLAPISAKAHVELRVLGQLSHHFSLQWVTHFNGGLWADSHGEVHARENAYVPRQRRENGFQTDI